MPKKILVILPFIFMLASPVLANSVAKSQRMLNQLGYNAGPIDGAYGGKTRGALEKFYADNGSLYDGKLDANEVADLRSSISARGLNSIAEIAVTDQHRFDNFPGIVNFQMSDAMRKSWFGYTWLTAFDTTDDGKDDLI
ncbi:peptidoglycan-binding protein, partial [Planktomarina temperata]|nr:peptidoglycan-binding protein [Planktomarina temperata]